MPKYLTTEEVAELLRTSPESVRFWRHAKKGPTSVKVGRRVLYPEDELTRWINQHRNESVVPHAS